MGNCGKYYIVQDVQDLSLLLLHLYNMEKKKSNQLKVDI